MARKRHSIAEIEQLLDNRLKRNLMLDIRVEECQDEEFAADIGYYWDTFGGTKADLDRILLANGFYKPYGFDEEDTPGATYTSKLTGAEVTLSYHGTVHIEDRMCSEKLTAPRAKIVHYAQEAANEVERVYGMIRKGLK